jgi:hypothetical protein
VKAAKDTEGVMPLTKMFIPAVVTALTFGAVPIHAQPAHEPQQVPSSVMTVVPTESISPQSLRLAEIAVLRLTDREVKLRFTLGGIVHPPFQTPDFAALNAYPPSGSLVTITVNPVAFPRP